MANCPICHQNDGHSPSCPKWKNKWRREAARFSATIEDGWCMGCGKPFSDSVAEARELNRDSTP